MTVLKFEGLVSSGHECRVSDDPSEPDGAVHIGGRDVVREATDAKWTGPVTVALTDERFEGALSGELGWGYSEYTPVDGDVLTVGPHNLIDILLRHEGESVTVWIADEPIDLGGAA